MEEGQVKNDDIWNPFCSFWTGASAKRGFSEPPHPGRSPTVWHAGLCPALHSTGEKLEPELDGGHLGGHLDGAGGVSGQHDSERC